MRFLIDAQLPASLCKLLTSKGLDSIHVLDLPEGDETPDKQISKYADTNDFIVITKDTDFYHSHMIHLQPKKLLLLTIGNVNNNYLFALIDLKLSIILQLFETCNYVELSNEGIFGHRY